MSVKYALYCGVVTKKKLLDSYQTETIAHYRAFWAIFIILRFFEKFFLKLLFEILTR